MKNFFHRTLRVLGIVLVAMVFSTFEVLAAGGTTLRAADENIEISVQVLRMGDPGYLAANPSIPQLNIQLHNKTNKPIQFVDAGETLADSEQPGRTLTKDILLPPQHYQSSGGGLMLIGGALANVVIPGALPLARAKVKTDKANMEKRRLQDWVQLLESLLQGKTIQSGATVSGSSFTFSSSATSSLFVEYKMGGRNRKILIPLSSPSVEVATTTGPAL